MRLLILALMSAMAMAGCDDKADVPATPAKQPEATRDRDNTGVNTRDRAADAKTADAQPQDKRNVELAAAIRRAVTDTKLSVNAQNCKIVAENGKVTLRGPVKSAEEKEAVGQIATSVAGAGNVDNQLEVEANP